MSEWRTLSTKRLIADGVLEIGDGYRAKNSEMSTVGVPFVRAGDVDGHVNTAGTDLLSEASFAKVGRKRSMAGDVVLTTKGTIGRMAFVRSGDPSFVYSPQLCFWRSLDASVINPRWLFFALRSGEMKSQMSWSAAQTDMAPYISLTDQRNAFHITVPPLRDQGAIAAILGALDDKIELNRKTAATLEEIARALYRSWFVDFDPVEAKAAGRAPAHMDAATAALFPDSFAPDGLPAGWRREAIYDQANWINGAAYKNMHFSDDSAALPVVKIAELKAGVTGNTKFTATDLGAKYRITRGELLFSWSGNPDTSIDAFVWPLGDAWLNQHIFAVRNNGAMSKAALFTMLRFFKPDFSEIARNKQTTGLGHITKKDLEAFKVNLAPKELMTQFEAMVAPIFERYCVTLYENETLAALRDTLLPKLMSGELRVGEAREQVEEVA